ncbi:MAG: hypothetical protein NTW18_03020 [Candidatus Omnitrophica bacterium]|nr:hypothetical protein [Candidatus Omnitrophota bacterium]
MSQSIPYEIFVETFCKEAISKFSSSAWGEVIKEEKILQDDKRIEWELFYLWVFLLTYCFQRIFAYLGEENIKIVLDGMHKAIYNPARHPDISEEGLKGVHNIIVIRYAQYYKAIKSDWEIMEKGAKMLTFSVLVDSFILNLLNINIENFGSQGSHKFTKFKLKFGLIISYFCRDLLDWFEKFKAKYEIEFT